VKVSVPFHSAAVETCVELVSRYPVVCQFVPFELLSQETQTFRPQSRQGGEKVRRKYRQGGPFSLHHRQCDNFRKIKQENAKKSGAVILYMARH
jgi:hypothetical protein